MSRRRDRKPLGRWIGEAILIFLSVFGAFYFDGIKDKRAQERNYLRSLKGFHADLLENQGKFNYELNSVFDPETGQGYITGHIQKLSVIDSLMQVANRTNGDALMGLINDNAVIGLTPWVFISPQYEKLNSQYYASIKNDTLKSRIQMHFRNNQSRIQRKMMINELVEEFYDIEDQLNKRVGGTPANRAVLYSNVAINKINRLMDGYFALKNITEANKGSDSLLIVQVVHELSLWGEQ
ncbi:hypothetical protein [Roseivirga misakiensis]|uniref:Uncharacterized protein n=1 Tax=Roseivirga misakiensis TaxID=1563681 RepID=A0A1E5SZD2_9BACT|nr:hypothetical protein [Roseivirga misakiensis]OEK04455.1 hypothetical protein BFP71_13350 [Roseivirga misakiensis]